MPAPLLPITVTDQAQICASRQFHRVYLIEIIFLTSDFTLLAAWEVSCLILSTLSDSRPEVAPGGADACKQNEAVSQSVIQMSQPCHNKCQCKFFKSIFWSIYHLFSLYRVTWCCASALMHGEAKNVVNNLVYSFKVKHLIRDTGSYLNYLAAFSGSTSVSLLEQSSGLLHRSLNGRAGAVRLRSIKFFGHFVISESVKS